MAVHFEDAAPVFSRLVPEFRRGHCSFAKDKMNLSYLWYGSEYLTGHCCEDNQKNKLPACERNDESFFKIFIS